MSEKITIIDYGRGNLHSVRTALEKIDAIVEITSDKEKIKNSEKVILPGVGAFGDCMENLKKYELVDVIKERLNSGKPFLGICLGLQLLFEGSEEDPGVEGLGYFKGICEKIKTSEKIPHMGWNQLVVQNKNSLLKNSDGNYVYFVHTYQAIPVDKSIITSVCDYGEAIITASVGLENVRAVQFHPEKSSKVGLEILKNFKEWKL